MVVIEDIDDESKWTHNVSVEKLYEVLKAKKLKAFPQHDKASNSKSELPEICLSRSDMKPQNNGINPSQNLKIGQMIKINLNIENIISKIRKAKKPYPVSYGNAHPDTALDSEKRGEERLQVDFIPLDKRFMIIYIPDNLFEENLNKFGIDRNKNVKAFVKEHPDFKTLVSEYMKKGLIKTYKDTSIKRYYAAQKNIREEFSYFNY